MIPDYHATQISLIFK